MAQDPYIPPGAGGLSVPIADRSELLMFPRLSTYSQIVARLQWNAAAIDLTTDARAWPELPADRRQRLTTLLAGFRVAEDSVAEHLVPFADRAEHVDTMMMWLFFLQRRDEDRHTQLFDRIAGEVMQLSGDTPDERRVAARALIPDALAELFEERLPSLARELADGRAEILDGVALYHMILEGAVFSAGQKALLDDLADDALPGIREGVERVERDERWHVGFGVRCLTEARRPDMLDGLLDRATEAAAAWGDAVDVETRNYAVGLVRRRLAIAGLVDAPADGPARV